MTRMWGVPPACLCREHLLGEHAEMHQEAGTIVNHPHGRAVARGHAALGQVDTSLLERRHDELAAELERRGHDHDSPFDYDLSDHSPVGYVDAHANLALLYCRCADCAARIRDHGGFVGWPSTGSRREP